MKKLIKIISIFLTYVGFAQNAQKQTVYLNFDADTNKTYMTEVDGRKVKEKFYIKEIKKNGDIIFYIEKEMFSLTKKEVDTCSIDYLNKIQISSVDKLKQKVSSINPLYPYKVFPNLYIIEKINDYTILKHKVKWEYYIE